MREERWKLHSLNLVENQTSGAVLQMSKTKNQTDWDDDGTARQTLGPIRGVGEDGESPGKSDTSLTDAVCHVGCAYQRD